jgi:hypothetical protein
MYVVLFQQDTGLSGANIYSGNKKAPVGGLGGGWLPFYLILHF